MVFVQIITVTVTKLKKLTYQTFISRHINLEKIWIKSVIPKKENVKSLHGIILLQAESHFLNNSFSYQLNFLYMYIQPNHLGAHKWAYSFGKTITTS